MQVETGEVVQVSLDPTIGGEKGKTRPCLVIAGSGHPWKIVIVVPLTNNNDKRGRKLFVPIPFPDQDIKLKKESCIDCFQIRCVAEERVKERLGKVSESVLDEVLSRIGLILNFGEEHA